MQVAASVRLNLSANFLGTGVAAVISLVSAPLLFKGLGKEAYGLVGVYILLQGLTPMFDLGLTPGLARAVAWHRGSGERGHVRTLVHLSRWPMYLLALTFGMGLFLVSGPLAERWINASGLPASSVAYSLTLMACALAVRMVAGLDRATLIALEWQVPVNIAQTLAVALRTLGALYFVQVSDTGVLGFFAVQVPISIAELAWYRLLLARALNVPAQPIRRAELNAHAKFGIGVAGLGLVWLVTLQVDKLALSRLLSLAEYGSYSLAVHIASAVLIVSGPVQAAVLPRLTRLLSSGNEGEARTLYGLATAILIALAAGIIVAVCIGGAALAALVGGGERHGAGIATVALVYAVGNAAIIVSGLAYQLQNARGRLGLHTIGTVLQACIQVPVLLFVAERYGALATAVAFAVLNCGFLVLWVPWVHNRFLPGGHGSWLRNDFLPPVLAAAVTGLVLASCLSASHGPGLLQLLLSAAAAAATLLAALAGHGGMRRYATSWWADRVH